MRGIPRNTQQGTTKPWRWHSTGNLFPYLRVFNQQPATHTPYITTCERNFYYIFFAGWWRCLRVHHEAHAARGSQLTSRDKFKPHTTTLRHIHQPTFSHRSSNHPVVKNAIYTSLTSTLIHHQQICIGVSEGQLCVGGCRGCAAQVQNTSSSGISLLVYSSFLFKVVFS